MSRKLVNKHMVDRHNREVAEYWKQEELNRAAIFPGRSILPWKKS